LSDLRELLHAAAPRAPEFDVDRLSGAHRRPRSGRVRPFVIGIAVVILIAVAGTAAVRAQGGSRPARRTPSATKEQVDPAPRESVGALRTALAAWSAFPVAAAPRPLVLLDDPVSAPASGFATTDAKEAFLSGVFVTAATLPSGPGTAAGYPVMSASDALAVMRAEGTPAANAPAAPTPLIMIKARFATARFRTDRGTEVLPAWLFTFSDVADPAAVLAVAPSSRFLAPADSLHQSSVSAELAPDGRTATIRFVGAEPGAGPCQANYAVDQLASSTAVAIKVREIDDSPADGSTATAPSGGSFAACSQVGHSRQVVIRLAAPLGGRVLVDATTTGPVSTAP
jgi:hypothetical protein